MREASKYRAQEGQHVQMPIHLEAPIGCKRDVNRMLRRELNVGTLLGSSTHIHTSLRASGNVDVQSTRMQLGHDYTRFDTLHLNSELIAVCSFHLHRDAPEFSAWKALLRHHIVLPRAAIRLHQERREVFVADPVMATLHDPGVAFRREPVAGQDDDSDYFILSEALIDELAASADVPTGRRRAGYRFGRSQAPLPDSLFRNAHRVFAQLRKSWASSPSLLWLEERAIALAAEIVCATERSSLPQPAIRSCPARGDAVTRAKCYLAEHLDRMPSLSEIASAAHSSPFHLTRLFRVRTGLSLHRYLMTLKARAAYLRLPLFRGRLARLATETGYTDLPHMSRQFERAFGAGPRALLRAEDAAT